MEGSSDRGRVTRVAKGITIAFFGGAIILALIVGAAVAAFADPKDGNPWVTIRHCEAQVDAENRNDQTLGYLIRIGEGVGDGRIVEEGTLRPGEKLRRIYRGEFFVRIRLGLNSDHYYSSHEGSTHCTGTPPPSPSPSPTTSPTPSPSPSPNPSPTPSVTPTPSPSASPTPPSPSPTVPSPTATPEATATTTPSVSPPAPPSTPGTPNTGGGPVFWGGMIVLALVVLGVALLSIGKGRPER